MIRIFHKGLHVLLIFSTLLLIGCKKEDKLLSEPGVNAPDRFPVYMTPDDFNDENTYYLLNDDESPDIFFDPNQRSFYVDQPIQITFDDDHYIQIRFYSPRALPKVTVWAKMEGYEEQFKVLELEKLMPFQQLRMKLPFATENITAQTRSGKTVKIMANPHLAKESLSFEIECDAPYYKALQSIKSHCHIRFQNFCLVSTATYGKWPLRAYQAREGVAIALNMFYLFSSPEFEAELKSWGPLIDKGVTLNKDEVLKKALGHGELKFGNVSTGVLGLGGGGIFCLSAELYLWHYPDDDNYTETIFHEYAHCIGYSHDGNMTYGGTTGWTALCGKMYTELGIEKKLPVYSRRFMSTRKTAKNRYNANGDYYYASKYVIEDPELDEIDGGLDRTTSGTTDINGENGGPVSFTLNHTAVPGATATTFTPKDVYVYNDSLFVVNDAKDNYSIEIFNIAGGQVSHLKSIKQWTVNDAQTTFTAVPNGITCANGRIYVTETGSRTWVFDAKDQHFIACLGNGQWGTSGLQTVHAYDVEVYTGLIMIHDKRYVVLAEEEMIDRFSPTLQVFTRSENLGEKDATYGMAVDTANNTLYTTHPNKRIDLFDLSKVRESTLARSGHFEYKNVPYCLGIFEGKLYVSSNGNEKFCQVDPKTGDILKDLTTAGGIKLQAPEKFCIRRQTLFIIDRVRNGMQIHAIPASNL